MDLGAAWEETVPVPKALFSSLIGSTYQSLVLGTTEEKTGTVALPILEASYVTADSGTGIVHTGMKEYFIALLKRSLWNDVTIRQPLCQSPPPALS